MNCNNCRKELHIGVDVLNVQEGVIGTRGIVPLADPLPFCSEACLREHFEEGVTTLPRRTP